MKKELIEFFRRCLESVEQKDFDDNAKYELAEDLEKVAEALKENDKDSILEY